jgi:hypothetical protein
MKVYWKYTCDFGHHWEFFRDEHAPEQPGDALCPQGHTAVTLQKERPVDKVQITLRPAAVIVDAVKNQVGWERHYWFILTDTEGVEERISARPYLWREVLGLAERFQGRSKASAWELWDKMGL